MWRNYLIVYKNGNHVSFRAKGLVRWNLFKLRFMKKPFFFIKSDNLSYATHTKFMQIDTKDILTVEVG